MKHLFLLISILCLTTFAYATDDSCVAAATSRSTILSRNANIYYRIPPTGNSIIRFTSPSSLLDQIGCTVRLLSKIVYRDGTVGRTRSLGKRKQLTSRRTTWTGPNVRKVLDSRPTGTVNKRSILYVSAEASCQGSVALLTDFVGRYVPNCGKSPSLTTADDFRNWLSLSLR